MLKLKRLGLINLVIWVGVVLLAMACDQQKEAPAGGCGGEVKEVIISLPPAEGTAAGIDKYDIEIVSPTGSEELVRLEGLPGESKSVSVMDTQEPLTVKVTALDALNNELAEGQTTATFGIDHNGLLCDMGLSMDLNPKSLSSLDATIDINVDCHIADIIQKVVEFANDALDNVVEISKYVVRDTVEDITNIIDIIKGG